MAAQVAPSTPKTHPLAAFFKDHRGLLLAIGALIALPFALTLLDGQSISSMLANEPGQSRFYQGLIIEVFILAVYAISYDLLFGVTGLLSFGHAMFYGLGAYLTGITLKSFGWTFWQALGGVIVASIVLALLISVVLPRVKGVTFALVTLGIAQVFYIVIQSREMVTYAGGEVGLQSIPLPEFINPVEHRLRFYLVCLAFMFLVYLIYQRFVDSPTGRVCVAIRENENRATMLGYNTFYFKLAALILSGATAGLAGMLHALSSPLIRPGISGVSFTIAALLMVLIGGIGTLSGALIGAALFRLLSFFLDKWFPGASQVIIGIVYILIVLFLPYGIVGAWRMKSLSIQSGWKRIWASVFPARK